MVGVCQRPAAHGLNIQLSEALVANFLSNELRALPPSSSKPFSDIIWWELPHLSTIWTEMTTSQEHGVLYYGRSIHTGVSSQQIRLCGLCGTSTQSHRHRKFSSVLIPLSSALSAPLLYVLLILALKYLCIAHYLKYVHLQFKVLTYHSYLWFSLKSQLLKEISKTACNSCSSQGVPVKQFKYRWNLLSSLLNNF